jgi:hypothetical protein
MPNCGSLKVHVAKSVVLNPYEPMIILYYILKYSISEEYQVD